MAQISNYRQRISGPMLDRIDILLEVSQPSPGEVLQASKCAPSPSGRSTRDMREDVMRAFNYQEKRWKAPILNGQVAQEILLKHGNICQRALEKLEREAENRFLSARAMGRILRIGRTLADLVEIEEVGESHIMEALGLHRCDWSTF